MVIRPASVTDADALGAMHHQSWVETWSDTVPHDFWEYFTVQARVHAWREVLEAGYHPHLALDEGRVVGVASASRGHQSPAPTELHALYLLRAYQGSGLATRLLHAEIGDEPTFLWVADTNARAIAFYRKVGFVADGTADILVLAGVDFPLIRMTRISTPTG